MEIGFWQSCSRLTLRDCKRNEPTREQVGVGTSIIVTIEAKKPTMVRPRAKHEGGKMADK